MMKILEEAIEKVRNLSEERQPMQLKFWNRSLRQAATCSQYRRGIGRPYWRGLAKLSAANS